MGRCKICRSKYWIVLEYLHLRKSYSYRDLIKAFDWTIPTLNLRMLSDHFNRHVRADAEKFYEALEKAEPEKQFGVLEFIHDFRDKWLASKRA